MSPRKSAGKSADKSARKAQHAVTPIAPDVMAAAQARNDAAEIEHPHRAEAAADPFRETIKIAHGPNQDGLHDQTIGAHIIPTTES